MDGSTVLHLTAVLALVACGHATAPSAPEPSCEAAAERTTQVSYGQAPPDLVARWHETMIRRCNGDRWPGAARQCYVALASADTMNACEEKLTPEQRTRLHEEFDK